MADMPTFTVKPALRCWGHRKDRPWPPCGRVAAWMRPPVNGGAPAYFCDDCRLPIDVAIPADPIFRRVTVTLDVLVAAVAPTLSAAHSEAVELLEAAVQALGGRVNLHAVTSAVGRYNPPREGPRHRMAKVEG